MFIHMGVILPFLMFVILPLSQIVTLRKIQVVHKRMARFQKLVRNLYLTLHGNNIHCQQRELSKFLMALVTIKPKHESHSYRNLERTTQKIKTAR
jgi:hypothetical protein